MKHGTAEKEAGATSVNNKKPRFYNVELPKDRRLARVIDWMNNRAHELVQDGEGPSDVFVMAVAAVHDLYPGLPLKERAEIALAAAEQIHAWLDLHRAEPRGKS